MFPHVITCLHLFSNHSVAFPKTVDFRKSNYCQRESGLLKNVCKIKFYQLSYWFDFGG
jgi:hypothetical protein